MRKARLALIGTGGTIAGTGELASYVAGNLSAHHLLADVPALQEMADWHIEQPFSADSRDLTPAHWLELAQRCQAIINDDSINGIIITHGTDTLEESAFALDLLLPSHKPVVLTAAMRPAGHLSADGPLNLLQAAQVANDPQSAQRGVLVVANDRIIAARFFSKTHTHAPDGLTYGEGGLEGHVVGQRVRYLRPSPPPHDARLQPGPGTALPRVDIIYGYAGIHRDVVDSAVAAGARGLVLAMPGHGSIPAVLRPALEQASRQGVVLVRASRVGQGGVAHNHNDDDDAQGLIAAGPHSALHARVLLTLALACDPQPALRPLFQA